MIWNAEQTALINSPSPIYAEAGPGTGKTSALVARLARILQDPNADPVLVLTFTRAGVSSIRSKLSEELAHLPWIHQRASDLSCVETFDGFIYRFLTRPILEELWPDRSFRFVESYESHPEGWVKIPGGRKKWSILDFEPDGTYGGTDPDRIEACESPSFSAELVSRYRCLFEAGEVAPKVSRNLVRETRLGMRELPKASLDARFQEIARRFSEIYVDEAQDSSLEDFEILDVLESYGSLISYIGDPKQEIYRFRGALGFGHKSHGRSETPLTVNYRSTPPICAFLEGVHPAGTRSGFGDNTPWPQVTVSVFDSPERYRSQIESICVDGKFVVLSHRKQTVDFLQGLPQPYGQEGDPLFDFVQAFERIELSVDSTSANIRHAQRYLELLLRSMHDAKSIAEAFFARTGEAASLSRISRELLALLLSKSENRVSTEMDRADCREEILDAIRLLTGVSASIEDIPELAPNGKSDSYPVALWNSKTSRNSIIDITNSGTIHSAKGLEFDNVSVVVAHWVPPGQKRLLDLLIEDGDGIDINSESINLFYVGASRAKYNLNIAFEAPRQTYHAVQARVHELLSKERFARSRSFIRQIW